MSIAFTKPSTNSFSLHGAHAPGSSPLTGSPVAASTQRCGVGCGREGAARAGQGGGRRDGPQTNAIGGIYIYTAKR
jgi:hypothetical protein